MALPITQGTRAYHPQTKERNMPRQDFNPNFVPEHMLEDARRGSLGPPVLTAQEVIARGGVPATWHCCHVDADPRWLGSQVACHFEAPHGSKAQARHLANAHVRKLTAKERRQAEDFEARRTAIYPKPWPCEKCGDTMRPSEVHWCRGTPTPVGQLLPHEAQAQAFAREGLKKALADLDD